MRLRWAIDDACSLLDGVVRSRKTRLFIVPSLSHPFWSCTPYHHWHMKTFVPLSLSAARVRARAAPSSPLSLISLLPIVFVVVFLVPFWQHYTRMLKHGVDGACSAVAKAILTWRERETREKRRKQRRTDSTVKTAAIGLFKKADDAS